MKIEIADNYYLNKHDLDKDHCLFYCESVEQALKNLDEKLLSLGCKKNTYCLDKSEKDDCLTLCEDGEFWSVFYMERGSRFHPAFFVSFDAAINFFLWKLTKGKVTYPF